MAHHQGMSLLALDNILNAAPMQRRFHRHPRVKAAQLLLDERAPGGVPPRMALSASPVAHSERAMDTVERTGLRSPGPLRLQLLGHAELSALVSATGTGVTTWQGLDINRFREDPVLGAGGVYLYIKNRTHNRLWSTGYQPTRAEPSFYNVAFSIDRAKWGPRTRQVQSTRPATDGTYSFSVFAGEYYVAALTDLENEDLSNPAFLEQLVPGAIRITVADGEKKRQDFRIVGR